MFGKRKKHTVEQPEMAKVRRRMGILQTPDLLDTTEAQLYDVGRALSEYRKSGDPMWIGYAIGAAEVLSLGLSTISARIDGAGSPSRQPASAG